MSCLRLRSTRLSNSARGQHARAVPPVRASARAPVHAAREAAEWQELGFGSEELPFDWTHVSHEASHAAARGRGGRGGRAHGSEMGKSIGLGCAGRPLCKCLHLLRVFVIFRMRLLAACAPSVVAIPAL